MRQCIQCQQDFVPSSAHKKCPKCRAKARVRATCPSCGNQMQAASKLCASCANARQDWKNNSAWKGGKTLHRAGYVMVRVKNHPRGTGYVFEHILVMEELLGRYLLPKENVHHKNGVKDDNRPENLELWSRSQPTGQRVEDLVTWAKEIIETYT